MIGVVRISYLQTVILGIIHGIAEFLPISRSGHLILMQNFFGFNSTGSYPGIQIMLNLGTLLAIILVFWQDIRGMAYELGAMVREIPKGELSFSRSSHRKLLTLLVVTSLPFILSIFFRDKVESTFAVPIFAGVALILTGLLILLSEGITKNWKLAADITYKNVLVLGFFRLISVFPGISSPAVTLFGSMLSGFNKRFAVKFSCLLSGIMILSEIIWEVVRLFSGAESLKANILCYIISFFVPLIVGAVAIKLLVRIIMRGRYKWISVYCFALGVLAMIANYIKF